MKPSSAWHQGMTISEIFLKGLNLSEIKLDEVDKTVAVNDATISALNRRIQLLEVEKNQTEIKVI